MKLEGVRSDVSSLEGESSLSLEPVSDFVSSEAGTAITATVLLILLLSGVRGVISSVTKLVEACKED